MRQQSLAIEWPNLKGIAWHESLHPPLTGSFIGKCMHFEKNPLHCHVHDLFIFHSQPRGTTTESDTSSSSSIFLTEATSNHFRHTSDTPHGLCFGHFSIFPRYTFQLFRPRLHFYCHWYFFCQFFFWCCCSSRGSFCFCLFDCPVDCNLHWLL